MYNSHVQAYRVNVMRRLQDKPIGEVVHGLDYATSREVNINGEKWVYGIAIDARQRIPNSVKPSSLVPSGSTIADVGESAAYHRPLCSDVRRIMSGNIDKPGATGMEQVNTDNVGKPFDYVLAMNYVHKALAYMGLGAPVVRKPKTDTTVKHGRKQQTNKAKTNKRKTGGSSHVRMVDENNVLDIVQSAFLLFHTAKNEKDKTTKRACRFAIGHYLQKETGRAKEDRTTVLHDYARHLEYMYGTRKRLPNGNGDVYDTILAWFETGASQADVASALGLPKQRVSDFVKHIRKDTEPHIDEYTQTIPHNDATPIDTSVPMKPARVHVTHTLTGQRIADSALTYNDAHILTYLNSFNDAHVQAYRTYWL